MIRALSTLVPVTLTNVALTVPGSLTSIFPTLLLLGLRGRQQSQRGLGHPFIIRPSRSLSSMRETTSTGALVGAHNGEQPLTRNHDTLIGPSHGRPM